MLSSNKFYLQSMTRITSLVYQYNWMYLCKFKQQRALCPFYHFNYFFDRNFMLSVFQDFVTYTYKQSYPIILQIMESTILFTILLLVLLTIYYQFWFKPQRIIKYYAKQLKARGYKILQCPYNPFQHDLIQTINRGVRQGDAMKIFKFQRGLYDVIVTNSMNRPKLQFNHPDFIKDFYSVDKHYEYPKEQKVVSLITRSSGRSQLSSSQGPQWKRKRTIFNKIFNFDFIKSQSYKISHLTTKALKEQERLGKKINDTVSYNIFEMATRIFSQVMMEIFLGGGSKQEVIDGQPAGLYLSRLIQDSSKQILRPLNYILGIKFLNLGITQEQKQMNSRLKIYKKWALQFVTKRIQEIKQSWQINKHKSIPSDIIQGLIMGNLKAKAEKSDEQTISSPQQIVDDFTSFFIAGIQTTATYTQMMIYYLAIYPRIEKKVRDQIDLYMKDDDYSYQNLKKFTYIEMLQKQTTRYFGPGTQLFPRIALHDNYLNGLPVKKGTQVLIMHMGNHYSEKYFNNPKQFRPQRWQSECNDIPPFVTGGFSAGARSCIGKHLAMLDSKIALIKFLKRYKKVVLPRNQFKIAFTFSVYPEQFEAIMTINQNEKLI